MEDRDGKMLVVILSGPEDFPRARQGLVFALNAERTGMLKDVQLLFFSSGVELLDPKGREAETFRHLLAQVHEEGLVPRACSGNLAQFKLQDAARDLEVEPVGAQVIIPARIREGYQVITF